MKFEYLPFDVEITGQESPVTIYRPMVPVILHGSQRSFSLKALLDTGADYSILPISVAIDLGMKVDKEKPLEIHGIGNNATSFYPASIDFELYKLGDTQYRWQTTVYCGQEESMILGQFGFFEFFRVTFDHFHRTLELSPSDSYQGLL